MIITKVDEGIWRGPEPQSAQDYLQLQDLGIRFTLDLETGAHWPPDGDPLAEALQMDTYGIRGYSHPLGAILPPMRSELVDAVGFLLNHKPVYVHCRQGVDRTGMVCAAYRVKIQRWGVMTAINEMKSLGMHWWYWYWIPQLDNL